MTRTLGILTIGQSPRDDIVKLFATHLPVDTRVILRGALDDLTDTEIDALRPLSGADTLYTRLRGGRDKKISKQAVIDRSSAVLAGLRADGCDAIVYACTGEFPPMEGDENVLFPSRVLAGLAHGLLPYGRLGLLVPFTEQGEKLVKKWERPGLDVVVEAVVPSASREEVTAAAHRLGRHKPDLVALDCMSYTPATKDAMRAALKVPILLAITATGRVLSEVLE